ncbi:MAG: hypothetical protein IKD25_07820 [Bacteroidaceae bacterium]|nr:hypothetical protein [Bacteroidaceae bacterium]
MKTDNIIYYKRWAKIASQMDDELRLVFFDAINAYILDGSVPSEDSPVYWVFLLMLEQLKADAEKYEDISEKRKEAVKKRWEKNKKSDTNEYKDIQNVQMYSNDTDNNNNNDNINDNDNRNTSSLSGTIDSSLSSPIVEDNIIESKASTSSDDDATLVLTPQEGGGKRVKDYSENVMRFWNHTMISPVAIPTIAKMTPKRKSMVNARVKEFGINMVYNAIAKASESSFLNGGGSKGFIADFDWVFRPNNFPKVLEGNYDDVKPINKNGNGTNERDKSRESREADLRDKERFDFITAKYCDIG